MSEVKRRYLRINEVLGILGISRSTLYRLMGDGKLPRPVKLTEKTAVWREADIYALMDEIEQRQGMTPLSAA